MSEPGDRIGRFQVIKPLAQGGMAEIFLARQEGPGGFGKTVVVKRVLSHLASDEGFIEMFQDEACLASQLSHPNVVQIFDFGEEDGTYYLAMEYLAGEDLSAIIRQATQRGRPVPPQIAALICSHALEGLHYAHTLDDEEGNPLGIVHRDVSPSNVMVTYQGSVKVLDFGIAKAAGKNVKTQVGTVKGKFMYMSPEQARGRPIDGRSDVFALGAVLYEMLTGVRLFQRENQMATLLAVTEQPIPNPKQHRPDLPTEIEEILMRALERDPGGRFSSALTMREALDEYLATRTYAPSHVQLRQFLLDLFGREHVTARQKITASPGSSAAVDTAVRKNAAKSSEESKESSEKRVQVSLGGDDDPDDDETIVPETPPPEKSRKKESSQKRSEVSLGGDDDPDDDETIVPETPPPEDITPVEQGLADQLEPDESEEDDAGDVDVSLDEEAIGDMPTRLVSISDIEAKRKASDEALDEGDEEDDANTDSTRIVSKGAVAPRPPSARSASPVDDDDGLDLDEEYRPKRRLSLALGVGAGAGLAAVALALVLVMGGDGGEDPHAARSFGAEGAGAEESLHEPEPAELDEQPHVPIDEDLPPMDATEDEPSTIVSDDSTDVKIADPDVVEEDEAPKPDAAVEERETKTTPDEPETAAPEDEPRPATEVDESRPRRDPAPSVEKTKVTTTKERRETPDGRDATKSEPRVRPPRPPPPEPEEAPEPEAPPPEEAGAAGGKGTLMVNCIPWCQIYINDEDIDRRSPARDIELPAGRHDLKVVNPPSGMEHYEDVEIRPGEQTVKVIRF